MRSHGVNTVSSRGGSSFPVRGGCSKLDKKLFYCKGVPEKFLISKGFLMQSKA